MDTSYLLKVAAFAILANASFHAQEPGTARWQIPTGDRIESSPSIGSDGTIYFGSWDNRLYAARADGTVKWSTLVGGGTTGASFMSSPALGPDGTIYVGSNDQSVYALAPDGTTRWTFRTGSWIVSSPAIAKDGTVYIGSGDSKLYAFKRTGGTPKWTITTGRPIGSSAAVGPDGTIYVGSDDRKVYAITPAGRVAWTFVTGDNLGVSSPAIGSDGTVYVGSGSADGSLHAINPDGTQKWKAKLGGAVLSPAIGSDGTIYVGASYTNAFWALSPEGTNKWAFHTSGAEVNSTPAAAADGTIYFGCADGKLYALNSDGSKRWEYATGGYVFSSPSIGGDGTIYVGSADGKLHAINGSSGLADSAWPKFRGDLRQSGKQHYFAHAPWFEFIGARDDGSFELIVLSRPAQTVSVEASPEFGAWSPVATDSASNGALRFLSPPQPALRHLFFRAFGP